MLGDRPAPNSNEQWLDYAPLALRAGRVPNSREARTDVALVAGGAEGATTPRITKRMAQGTSLGETVLEAATSMIGVRLTFLTRCQAANRDGFEAVPRIQEGAIIAKGDTREDGRVAEEQVSLRVRGPAEGEVGAAAGGILTTLNVPGERLKAAAPLRVTLGPGPEGFVTIVATRKL